MDSTVLAVPWADGVSSAGRYMRTEGGSIMETDRPKNEQTDQREQPNESGLRGGGTGRREAPGRTVPGRRTRSRTTQPGGVSREESQSVSIWPRKAMLNMP